MNERLPDPLPTFSRSPRWGAGTKLVVAITFVAIAGFMLVRFRQIVGPLLIAVVMAYLFYPVAERMKRRLGFSWRLAVTIIFAILLVVMLGLLFLGGLAIIEQVQSLIVFIQTQIRNIPDFLSSLSQQRYVILGFFEFDMAQLDLASLGEQLLSMVQPLLSYTGTAVGAVATGAATMIGWIFFTLLVSYFILADSGGVQAELLSLSIPGYKDDFDRMGKELGRIWNAFLRGQMIIFFITILVYLVLLGGLQVNFFFGLALLAGLARFVPYIGPAVAWTTYGLVCVFQGHTIFGMSPVPYALLVVGIALVVDMAMDNYVTPRMMGSALEVHPAAVMIAALVSANLFGVIGMVLAAPVLATIKLVFRYMLRKMFDQDPWADMPPEQPLRAVPFSNAKVDVRPLVTRWSHTLSRRLKRREHNSS